MPDQIAMWCLTGILDCSGEVPGWLWWVVAVSAGGLLFVIVLIVVTVWRSK